MAYCSKTDLVERYGQIELAQLTDESAAANADDAEIVKACDEATSLIDAYLFERYLIPLSPVPTVVRKWACDIARKYLWKDRAEAESAVERAYQEAVAHLKDIARGIVSLPDATGAGPLPSSSALAIKTSAVVFTDDLLAYMPG